MGRRATSGLNDLTHLDLGCPLRLQYCIQPEWVNVIVKHSSCFLMGSFIGQAAKSKIRNMKHYKSLFELILGISKFQILVGTHYDLKMSQHRTLDTMFIEL